MLKLKILLLLISVYFSIILGNSYNLDFGFINKKIDSFVIDRDEPFAMSCQYYTNNANDYKLKWFKLNVEISVEHSHISNSVEHINCPDKLRNSSVLCFNSTLIFNYVCPSDLGIYDCVIIHYSINNNNIDITTSNTIHKQIVYKPIDIKINFNQLDEACLQSNVRLRCEVIPRAFDVQLFIHRDNQFIGEKVDKFKKCKNMTVRMFANRPIEYVIHNATFNNSGMYYCQVLFDYRYSRGINLTIHQCSVSTKSERNWQFKMRLIGIIMGFLSIVFIFVVFCIKKRVGARITPKYRKSFSVDSQKYSFPTDLIRQSTFNFSKQMKLRTLRLIKILGSGEFGEVYLGKATSFDSKNKFTLVAVKFLKHNAPSGNFMMEKDIMANLGDHDNIVKYIGFVNLPDKIAIVMEYAKNGSLLNLLKVFQFSPSNTNERVLCQFGIDVASGMEYLSSMNMVHRDLAARNVFVSEFWVLKIGDFGLTREACNYYRQINEGKVPIRWLALESLLFKKYSTMSDIWSFGILLWEIFSLGQTPYSDVTDISLLTNLIVRGKRNLRPAFCKLTIYNMMLKTWHSIASERPSFTDIILELKDILSECSCDLVRYE